MHRPPGQKRPEFRNLRIFAIDPMVGRGGDHQVTVQIRLEDVGNSTADGDADPISIKSGRVEVVDVDTSSEPATWLKCVDLDDTHIAMQHGLEPSESDPQFHQQMVYAVAMRTLEHFDRALGRVVYFGGRRRLRLVPHAFQGRNAFYHPGLRAVLFGYFRASEDSPGENLPGQYIFTCLSHDIIAHEVTHAVVDRLRPCFSVATNPQVRAFHEAYADLVAVFQRLTYKELVRQALQDARGQVAQSSLLSNIAAQFGEGLGSGRALRTALDNKTTVADVREEHELGAVLVAAIFEGFHKTYEKRTADLLRIATGGTGVLPLGALHPDLVARLAAECCRTAQSVLTMCIRALDYLPPVDVTFASFLRALVTADWELNPLDEAGLRAAVIEACRRRRIFATEAGSLEIGALLLDSGPREDWSRHKEAFQRWVDLAVRIGVEEQRESAPEDEGDFADWLAAAQEPSDRPVARRTELTSLEPEVEPAKELREAIFDWFAALGGPERERLGLRADSDVQRRDINFHPSQRPASDGTLRFGLTVQLVERRMVNLQGEPREIPNGALLVIDVSGRVLFTVRANPADKRLSEMKTAVEHAACSPMGWREDGEASDALLVDYHGMHEMRTR